MKTLSLKTFRQLGIDEKIAMDCFDTPLAYAASYYEPDYYFSYFLLCHLYNNWEPGESSFEKAKNHLLEKLGLRLTARPARSREELFALIRRGVEEGTPVFLIFDYFHMFFEPAHYRLHHIPHGALITGYEEDRQRFLLQDGAHMSFTGLYPLYLTEDMVYEIWESSGAYFRTRPGSPYCDRVFYIEKVKEGKLRTLRDAFVYFLEEGRRGENKLVEILRQDDLSPQGTFLGQMNLRRDFYTAHETMFDVIEKIGEREEIFFDKEVFSALREDSLRARDTLISRIILLALRGRALGQQSRREWAETMENLDGRLFAFLQGMLDKIKENGIVNYAFHCAAAASSQSHFDGISFAPENAVNGVTAGEGLRNMWASQDKDPVHWIAFDLQGAPLVKTIVLHARPDTCPEDFLLQGSNDGQSWETIRRETGNQRAKIVYRGLALHYRHYRLYITCSSAGAWAGLQEFEAWG